MSEHRLAYRPPLARAALLAFLALRATPGVEEVVGDSYRRVVSIDGATGVLSARLPPHGDEIELELDDALAGVLGPVLAGARRVFDLDADAPSIDATLADDPRLRPLVQDLPGLRVPGAIDAFEMAVRAIVGQQISVAAARTITGRLAARYGEPLETGVGSLRIAFPRPEAVATGTLDRLGMPATRLATLVGLARAICEGDVDLSPGVDPEETRATLLAIHGVGPWTADYVAMRGLGDPDAFPASDLVIRQVLGDAGDPLSARAAEQQSQRWRPWRAYAVAHLWTSAPAVRLARVAS
ncbi:MAG: AraC family transcriptional regulator [Gaiellales bacterium]|nr:AraC family transcriptional regulator [Gaiellales bacterium]